jgi:hypothetical protein
MNKKTWQPPQILTLEEGIGDKEKNLKRKCRGDVARFRRIRRKKCKKKKGVKFS